MIHQLVPKRAKSPCEPLPHPELAATKGRQAITQPQKILTYLKSNKAKGWGRRLTFVHGSELIIQFKAAMGSKNVKHNECTRSYPSPFLHPRGRAATLMGTPSERCPLACSTKSAVHPTPLLSVLLPKTHFLILSLFVYVFK